MQVAKNWNEVGLSLVEVTAQTAAEVFAHSGKNDKHTADHVAVEGLRARLQGLPFRMTVVSGEGEKDKAPMLFSGERLGNAGDSGPGLDLIVDPLECTTNFARGLPDSMVVLAATEEGATQPVPGTYMKQMLLPAASANRLGRDINLDSAPAEVLELVGRDTNRKPSEITVVVQDRPRHQQLIAELRAAGASVALVESGSISAALEIAAEQNGRLTMMWGIFGAPEGLIIALLAALTGLGFLGRIEPHDETTTAQAELLGLARRSLTAREWVQGPGVLICSGLHSNSILPGVSRGSQGLTVHSLLWAEGTRSRITHSPNAPLIVREF